MGVERRGQVIPSDSDGQPDSGRSQPRQTKPFAIPKALVYQAYKRVRANQGSAGIDDQSLDDFDRDLGNNLYKTWNRLSSGSPGTESGSGGSFQSLWLDASSRQDKDRVLYGRTQPARLPGDRL
ncbi:MAG: hypothetical protein ACTHWH_13430 [Marinobacter sp.]